MSSFWTFRKELLGRGDQIKKGVMGGELVGGWGLGEMVLK